MAAKGFPVACVIGPSEVLVTGSFATQLSGLEAGNIIVPDKDNPKAALSPASKEAASLEQDEDSVWTKDGRDHPSRERNRSATVKLIELYKKHIAALNNKNVVKKNIWNEIAQEMHKSGFKVTGGKCHQKWRNLERDYRSWVYCLNGDSSGWTRKSPPECIEELHEIFQARHQQFFAEEGQTVEDMTIMPAVEDIKNMIRSDTYNRVPALNEVFLWDSAITENGSESESSSHQSMQGTNLLNRTVSRNGEGSCDGKLEQKSAKFRRKLKRPTSQATSDIDRILDAIRKMKEEEALENRQRFENLQKLLEKQHKERMECMHQLLEAIRGKKPKLKSEVNSSSLDVAASDNNS